MNYLRKQINNLERQLLQKDEEIARLTEENERLKNARDLPAANVRYAGPSTEEIRDIVSQEISPVRKRIDILINNVENPADTALRALGTPESRVCEKFMSNFFCLL